jgi:hypothetical protein
LGAAKLKLWVLLRLQSKIKSQWLSLSAKKPIIPWPMDTWSYHTSLLPVIETITVHKRRDRLGDEVALRIFGRSDAHWVTWLEMNSHISGDENRELSPSIGSVFVKQGICIGSAEETRLLRRRKIVHSADKGAISFSSRIPISRSNIRTRCGGSIVMLIRFPFRAGWEGGESADWNWK